MSTYEKLKELLNGDKEGLNEIVENMNLLQDLVMEVEDMRIQIAKMNKSSRALWDKVESLEK